MAGRTVKDKARMIKPTVLAIFSRASKLYAWDFRVDA